MQLTLLQSVSEDKHEGKDKRRRQANYEQEEQIYTWHKQNKAPARI